MVSRAARYRVTRVRHAVLIDNNCAPIMARKRPECGTGVGARERRRHYKNVFRGGGTFTGAIVEECLCRKADTVAFLAVAKLNLLDSKKVGALAPTSTPMLLTSYRRVRIGKARMP